VLRVAPWVALGPGAALVAVVLCVNALAARIGALPH
jgi:ABC-type dipeptide/oligopeptide/nickel transport system permease subunit